MQGLRDERSTVMPMKCVESAGDGGIEEMAML